jgi:hypothetical protein
MSEHGILPPDHGDDVELVELTSARTERIFEVEALITVTVAADTADPEEVAKGEVDAVLQRAWDTDRGRHHVGKWHFELLPDTRVTDITDDET